MAATDTAPLLRAAGWEGLARVRHGFFGRHGGVSTGDCASLNLSASTGDDPAAVAENWRRVGAWFPRATFVRMRQVHGVRMARVTAADHAAVGEADGLLSATPGLALAVLTADCVPLLAVAPAAGAVMAVHAGWRGTVAGIGVAALREAETWLGVRPSDWHVALGPAIDGCCYEVEREIGAELERRWGAMPDAWQAAGAQGQLDLRAANRQQLVAHGVPPDRIEAVGPCTACRSDAFFSHRRTGGRAGRQLSAIGLDPVP